MSLTPKQEKFIQGVLSGLSKTEAYKQSYNTSRMKESTINEQASKLFNDHKVTTRYQELVNEHKEKALYTREEAVNDLIWLKEVARGSINQQGLKQANGGHYLNSVKELATLEDLYPKDKVDNKEDKLDKYLNELEGVLDAIK